jgi:hypothetical protein
MSCNLSGSLRVRTWKFGNSSSFWHLANIREFNGAGGGQHVRTRLWR